MQDFVDFVMRLWADLLARPRGPFGFRLAVQPMIALLLAVRDGVQDAKTGRSPYFWSVLHDPPERAGAYARRSGRRRRSAASPLRST